MTARAATAITLNIEQGLNFVLYHFQDQPIFPRSVSTKTTEGRQILVESEKEALARFAQANFLDCRISAYPPNVIENPSVTQRFVGLHTATPTNLIVMIDLDRCNFRSERPFNMAFTRTLNNIKEKLNASPTVLWSGRGYHIIQPMNSNGIILETIKEFEDIPNISLKFLRYAESFLSYKKSDLQHNNTVSFNNCMLRVPGSTNSKNGQIVTIIQKWNNGYRPEINYLLGGFTRHIINEKYTELIRARKRSQNNPGTNDPNKVNWIEQLLQTPIADHRKYCIWRVLSAYLLNIKKLPEQEAFNIIKEWLQHCSELQRLNFSVSQRITDGLDGAAKRGYLPISLEKLKEENNRLYSFLHVSGVVEYRQ
jgi:hypothetical protein